MGLNDQRTAVELDANRIDLSTLAYLPAPISSSLRRGTYQVVYRQDVLDAIHRHGSTDTKVEVCGVLVGKVYRDVAGPWLSIESSIRGDAADGHATQVTFKAETWEYIQREMESKHPDRNIVGWYHTHPGFGIFLSGMDLFIQDNFFNLPWQVAFVYDPVGGDEGSFVWRSGRSEREEFLVDGARAGGQDTAPRLARSAPLGPVGGATLATSGDLDAADDSVPPQPREVSWILAASIVFIVSFLLAGLWFAFFHSS